MMEVMLKNLLMGFGITEKDLLKARDDFALLASSAKQLSENQQLLYDTIMAMRAELAALRAEVNPGYAAANFPSHLVPLSKDEILNPQPQLALGEPNHGPN